MQGLRQLYAHTGRRAEWARLVEEIVPDFIDPATEGPLPGREEDWGLVTEYRVRLLYEARQWAVAEHLQKICVGVGPRTRPGRQSHQPAYAGGLAA